MFEKLSLDVVRFLNITFALLFQVELKFQQNIIDTQLCGGRFLDREGHSFGITGYDLTEVSIFSKK